MLSIHSDNEEISAIGSKLQKTKMAGMHYIEIAGDKYHGLGAPRATPDLRNNRISLFRRS
jgi:hypothetical protein